MATRIDAIMGEALVDPDAQATVTDFQDYTEYLPDDLFRSLTLIGTLDSSYLDHVEKVHRLSQLYGSLPGIPRKKRPRAQRLRQQISKNLEYAISARESAAAEATRLFDAIDRHSNRLRSVISKLHALPKPASRDPTPSPQAMSPPASRSRSAFKTGTEGTTRIKLHGPRPVTSHATSVLTPRHRNRTVTVPGDVLPPPNPDSPAADSEWGSVPPSPPPMPTQRVGVSSRKRANVTPRIRSSKPPKSRVRTPKVSRTSQTSGILGTNIHSAVAGISTSNALSLLSPPPADAKRGTEHAPWMRLTEWEMAKLRKRMKKNAIWSPSETMIRRELADAGRGPENYRSTKAKADAVGENFVDEDNLANQPQGKPLQPGEISAASLASKENALTNRGMKLNEAKRMKREIMLKEMAALRTLETEQAAKTEDTELQVEQAAKRLSDIGSSFKNLFLRNPSTVTTSSAIPVAEKEKTKEERTRARRLRRQKQKERKQALGQDTARENSAISVAEKEKTREERNRARRLRRQKEKERKKALEQDTPREKKRQVQEQKKREKAEEEGSLELELELERQRQAEREIREKEEQEAKAREEEEKAREADREAAKAAARKRKRNVSIEVEVPQAPAEIVSPTRSSPKRRHVGSAPAEIVSPTRSSSKRRHVGSAPLEVLTTSATTTVPLAAPAASPGKRNTQAQPITSPVEARRSTRRPSLTLRGPAPPSEQVEPSPRSATRASTRRASTGEPAISTIREPRRRSATPAAVSTSVSTAASRRSRRSAPGPVISNQEGGAAVSVGKRKNPPRKIGTAGATVGGDQKGNEGANRGGPKEMELQMQEDAAGEEIDPNEERYCVCGDVSWGEMIKCDNGDVSILPTYCRILEHSLGIFEKGLADSYSARAVSGFIIIVWG
ncbi:MAG: hypothetical protein Q9190_006680 [Brigantiaea leucoxantha]